MKKALILLSLTLVLLLAACQSSTATPSPSPTGASPLNPSANEGYPYPPPGATPTEYAYPAPQSGSNNVEPSSAQPAYPAPGSNGGQRGEFFIEKVELQPNPSQPGQMDVYVAGSLPTPCNQPQATVNPPDSNNKIVVEVYSTVTADQICTQVLQPYEGVIASISGLASGQYTVVVNDQPAINLTIP